MRRIGWSSRRTLRCAMMTGCAWVAAAGMALAQGSGAAQVSSVTLRPFVIGWVPVVNGGAVGGVLIDAAGVVARADVDEIGRLREARNKALQPIDGDLAKASTLRMVSLRRLEAAIAQRRQKDQPLTDAMLFLAGIQRVRYVFLDLERRDVILAGPAEGWQVGPDGTVVGRTTGQPLVRLDDLITALRTAEAASEAAISCSIDPTPEGVRRFRGMLATPGLTMNDRTLARLEKAVGPQRITIQGVDPSSHFARTMVAADILMKRLAMGLEKPPIDGMPSYMEMVGRGTSPPREAMPRWWLAPDYQPLLRDREGIAWELRGPGVKAMTEDTLFAANGTAAGARKAHPLARQWADSMTKNYEPLSEKLPALAELRCAMDLAVIAALLVKYDLPAAAGFEMPLLMNAKVARVVEHRAPQTVDSQARFVRVGRRHVVSVSGGVEINSWAIADRLETKPSLAAVRTGALAKDAARWWWD